MTNLVLSKMPEGLLAFIIIVAIAAAMAIIAFVIYKLLNPKLKDEQPSDEEILQEELNRVLEPIKDDETAKQVSDYKETDED